jgi:hydrogenase maturation protease
VDWSELAGPEVPPTLVIAVGNPSRGDDALGPALAERLATRALPGVECMTDFQLQVEYALDLIGRDRVVFVDACVDGEDAWRLARVSPAHDASFSTHALSPSAVLDTYVQLTGLPTPDAHVLAIRGYRFDLGTPLSPEATANLERAFDALVAHLEPKSVGS